MRVTLPAAQSYAALCAAAVNPIRALGNHILRAIDLQCPVSMLGNRCPRAMIRSAHIHRAANHHRFLCLSFGLSSPPADSLVQFAGGSPKTESLPVPTRLRRVWASPLWSDARDRAGHFMVVPQTERYWTRSTYLGKNFAYSCGSYFITQAFTVAITVGLR